MHVNAVIERAGSGNRRVSLLHASFCVISELEFIFEVWLYTVNLMAEVQSGKTGRQRLCASAPCLQKEPAGAAQLKARFTQVCCGSAVVPVFRTAGQCALRSGAPLSRRGVHGVSREVIFHAQRHRGYSPRAMLCLCGLHSKFLNTHLSWSGLILSGQTDNGSSVWRQNPPHKETTYKYAPL